MSEEVGRTTGTVSAFCGRLMVVSISRQRTDSVTCGQEYPNESALFAPCSQTRHKYIFHEWDNYVAGPALRGALSYITASTY